MTAYLIDMENAFGKVVVFLYEANAAKFNI